MGCGLRFKCRDATATQRTAAIIPPNFRVGAAERGLPALGIWLWLIAALTIGLFRLFRRQPDKVLSATGLAAIAAMLAAGLFEYNFGDSEFLMLFLVLVTLPFAATHGATASHSA